MDISHLDEQVWEWVAVDVFQRQHADMRLRELSLKVLQHLCNAKFLPALVKRQNQCSEARLCSPGFGLHQRKPLVPHSQQYSPRHPFKAVVPHALYCNIRRAILSRLSCPTRCIAIFAAPSFHPFKAVVPHALYCNIRRAILSRLSCPTRCIAIFAAPSFQGCRAPRAVLQYSPRHPFKAVVPHALYCNIRRAILSRLSCPTHCIAIFAAPSFQGCRAPRAVLQYSPRHPFKAVVPHALYCNIRRAILSRLSCPTRCIAIFAAPSFQGCRAPRAVLQYSPRHPFKAVVPHALYCNIRRAILSRLSCPTRCIAIFAAPSFQGCRAPRAVLQYSPRHPFKAVVPHALYCNIRRAILSRLSCPTRCIAIFAAPSFQGCRAPRAVLQYSPRHPFKAVVPHALYCNIRRAILSRLSCPTR